MVGVEISPNFCKVTPEESEKNNNVSLDCASQSSEKVHNDSITGSPVRKKNVGNSDYSEHYIQPWDIWAEYHLNPWDADIVKRVLRKKEESGMTQMESRILDYKKIIHVCQERIRQLKSGYNF